MQGMSDSIDPDDGELELEPVDPTVLAAERERAERKTTEALSRVDVEEVVREAVPDDGYDLDLSPLKHFRFTTRHLLLLTAVLAVAMTMKQQLSGVMALFVAAVVGVAGGWFYIWREERRREAQRQRLKETLLSKGFGTGRTGVDAGSEGTAGMNPAARMEPRPAFRFSFSTKQLLITTAVAAVVFMLLKTINPEVLSLTLGILAILGIVVYAAGFDAPPALILGWWLLLAIYLAVGFLAAILGRRDGGATPLTPVGLRDYQVMQRADCGDEPRGSHESLFVAAERDSSGDGLARTP
jgi:hypothetical protein